MEGATVKDVTSLHCSLQAEIFSIQLKFLSQCCELMNFRIRNVPNQWADIQIYIPYLLGGRLIMDYFSLVQVLGLTNLVSGLIGQIGLIGGLICQIGGLIGLIGGIIGLIGQISGPICLISGLIGLISGLISLIGGLIGLIVGLIGFFGTLPSELSYSYCMGHHLQ